MAFAEREPVGAERLEVMIAQLTAVVANIARGKQQRAYAVDDFLPRYWQPRRPAWERMLEQVRGLNTLFGGRGKRR